MLGTVETGALSLADKLDWSQLREVAVTSLCFFLRRDSTALSSSRSRIVRSQEIQRFLINYEKIEV